MGVAVVNKRMTFAKQFQLSPVWRSCSYGNYGCVEVRRAPKVAVVAQAKTVSMIITVAKLVPTTEITEVISKTCDSQRSPSRCVPKLDAIMVTFPP